MNGAAGLLKNKPQIREYVKRLIELDILLGREGGIK